VIFGLRLAREMGTECFPMAFRKRCKKKVIDGKTKLQENIFELKTLLKIISFPLRNDGFS